MGILVRIPAAWREATGGVQEVGLPPAPLLDTLVTLGDRLPALRPKLFDREGHLDPHLSLFINQEYVRYREEAATALQDGDEVYIMPMIAGGCSPL